ncbi:hypothetical protein N161109_197 [Synechococcus phage S-CAM9]|uniref:Uncharacterized protein n=1 Tax=Synechococcus phage S-CAM9 TaxID=1883369 RepID=A0A1D8KQ72_9CAUD|nr:hypothetical protein BOW85_gp052 [Synechococcus phage S-CAM9]AOV60343.1 hypothetical protein S050808_196 [Synechococcus phage S-CAM9]AOV60800.1 hypothetical protein N161109_197 [Synechococcus phage S-CAM9]
MKKDELNVRVLKLKKMLYDGTYHEANADWHDGAHHMLNKVLDVLDEYRF